MSIMDKADLIQRQHSAAVKRAREDKHLSAEGRRVALAKAYRSAKKEMVETQATLEKDLTSRRAHLTAQAYGRLSPGTTGYDVIAYRQAVDRAANLKTPREAMTLLARVERSGDTGLAAAIAQHAESLTEDPLKGKEWTSVVRAYFDARPHLEGALNELSEIDTYLSRGHLRNSLRFNLMPPEEIRDIYNTPRLDAVADSA